MTTPGDPRLTLVVLRVADLAASRSFYEGIGLLMRPEQHGDGPAHLSAVAGHTVFELYPVGTGPSSRGTRIGWSVDDLDLLPADGGHAVQEHYGHRLLLLADPDGHKVEITEHGDSLSVQGERFAGACRDLFAVIEGTEGNLLGLYRGLLGVLVAIHEVPAVEPTSPEPDADPTDLAQDSEAVGQRVAAIVSSADTYGTVFDSTLRQEPTARNLVTDVVDIYQDLRRGLEQFEAGNVADGLWEWRFSYRTHWGRHATEAVRCLHRLTTEDRP